MLIAARWFVILYCCWVHFGCHRRCWCWCECSSLLIWLELRRVSFTKTELLIRIHIVTKHSNEFITQNMMEEAAEEDHAVWVWHTSGIAYWSYRVLGNTPNDIQLSCYAFTKTCFFWSTTVDCKEKKQKVEANSTNVGCGRTSKQLVECVCTLGSVYIAHMIAVSKCQLTNSIKSIRKKRRMIKRRSGFLCDGSLHWLFGYYRRILNHSIAGADRYFVFYLCSSFERYCLIAANVKWRTGKWLHRRK